MAFQTALVLSILCLFHTSYALYFHIGETERKCFIEEIPDDTTVVGNYKVQAYDSNVKDYLPVSPGIGMHVDITDPEDKLILSRTYAAEGRFTFSSHTAGEHVICLNSNSSAWFQTTQLRVHLDISVGEAAVDYQQVQAKDKLTELQLRVRQLLDQVEQITKEQNYQRDREERFRQTSDSTNSRVFVWAMIQIATLVVLGLWQSMHLRNFFISKKLV